MVWFQNAFNTLITGINAILDFLHSTSQNLFQIIKLIPQIFSNILVVIGTMPTFLQVFAIVTITILVIYLVLGRDNGGS